VALSDDGDERGGLWSRSVKRPQTHTRTQPQLGERTNRLLFTAVMCDLEGGAF